MEIGLVVIAGELPLLGKVSSYGRLKRVTACVCHFIHNCRARSKGEPLLTGVLASPELVDAENLWIASAQQSAYPNEVNILRKGNEISSGPLLVLHPVLDESGLMRVGGRLSQSSELYYRRHPIIVPGRYDLTKLMVRYEHLRVLHARPTLVTASLARQYAIIGARKVICDVTRTCLHCKRVAGKPCTQLLGQLPADRLRPGHVFDRVGVDYAGPILIKSGYVRRPIITKAYVCVLIGFSIKAVHLESVSELTSTAFIARPENIMLAIVSNYSIPVFPENKPIILWTIANNRKSGNFRVIHFCSIKFSAHEIFVGRWSAEKLLTLKISCQ